MDLPQGLLADEDEPVWSPVSMLRAMIEDATQSAHGPHIMQDFQVFPISRHLTMPEVVSVELTSDQQHLLVHYGPAGEDANASRSITGETTSHALHIRHGLNNFVHDYTCSILSKSTDRPLWNLYRMGNADDNKTPDDLVAISDGWALVEYTTSRRRDRAMWRMQLEEKRQKYHLPFLTRVQKLEKSNYSEVYVLITKEAVMSNAEVPQELVDELVAMYILGRAIFDNYLRPQGLVSQDEDDQDENTSEDEAKLNAILNILPVITASDQKGFFTSEQLADYLAKMESNPDSLSSNEMHDWYTHCYQTIIKNDASLDVKCDVSKVIEEEMVEIKKKVSEWIQKALSDNSTRGNPKSVIQLPLWSASLTTPDSSLMTLPRPVEGEHLMTRIWSHAISEVQGGNVEHAEENIDKTWMESIAAIDVEQADSNLLSASRIKYHRVTLDLSPEDSIDLAKQGVHSKQYSDNPAIKANRDRTQLKFSFATDVSDIDRIIENPEIFIGPGEGIGKTIDEIHANELIKKAVKTHDPDFNWLPIMNTIYQSAGYDWSSMVSDIGVECAISLRQHCTGRKMILKKLRHRDMFLLICPTNSKSGVRVSFMLPKRNGNKVRAILPFKKIYETPSFYCTEFSTFNSSTLVNLVLARSHYIAQCAQWTRYVDEDVRTGAMPKEVMKMVTLVMMVALEDNHHTADAPTQLRYICMKKFTLPNIRTNVVEFLPKLETAYRSRLQLWFTRCLVSEISRPRYVRTQDDLAVNVDDKPKGSWQGLTNPYTGAPLTDARQLIDLFYIGYIKNKNEMSETNADMALVRKIVKCEMEWEKADPTWLAAKHGYRTETGEYKTFGMHEFSATEVLKAARAFNKRVAGKVGGYKNVKETLSTEITRELLHLQFENLATLKASSIWNPDEPRQFQKEDGSEHTHRAKAIETVTDLLRDYKGVVKPYELIPNLLMDRLPSKLHADIFKKNQHGGLREIFVLDIKSRILAKILELIARVLCDQLPEEALTHPEEKTRAPVMHSRYVRARFRGMKSFSVAASNDATTWNQTQHANKFGAFLCCILEKKWHGLIMAICSIWHGRKIKLPDGVVNALATTTDLKLHDKIDQAIVGAYNGSPAHPWLGIGGKYLQINSGFMQGILHYCSSLWHVCCGIAKDEAFKSQCANFGLSVHTTQLFSSDDSGKIITVAHRDERMLTRGILLSIIDSLMVDQYYSACGIIVSPKSARCCSDVFEFNSEFFIGTSLYRPSLKWVQAAFSISEKESIFERQEEMSNLLTECLEGGCPILQTHVTQIAQAFMHYTLMGMNISPIFDRYTTLLQCLPDPSLGYFLMDNPMIAGVSGIQYNYWKALKSEPLLAARITKLLSTHDLTTTTSGAPNSAVLIKWGYRKRWQALRRKLSDVYPEWETEINENPRVLYKAPSDWNQVMTRIMVKITNPSVGAALNSANSVTRTMAASVYMLARPSMSLSQAWVDDDERDSAGRKRHSLVGLIIRDLVKLHCMPMPTSDELDNTMKCVFIHHDGYHELQEKVQGFSVSKMRLEYTPNRRMIKSTLMVLGDTATGPSLEKICGFFWWGVGYGQEESVAAAHLAAYQAHIPWLDRSYDVTLEQSPFNGSHVQLRNFVARNLSHPRRIRITGAPIAAHSSQVHVVALMMLNLWPHLKLVGDDVVTQLKKSSNIAPLIHVLSAYNHLPFIDTPDMRSRRVNMMVREMAKYDPPWSLNDAPASRRLMQYSIIMKVASMLRQAKSTDTLAERDVTLRMIEMTKGGMVGSWGSLSSRDAQRLQLVDEILVSGATRSRWVGRSQWNGRVGDCHLTMIFEDDEVVTMITNSLAELAKHNLEVAQFVHESAGKFAKTGAKISGGDVKIYVRSAGRRGLEFIHQEAVPLYERPDMRTAFTAESFWPSIKIEDSKIKLMNTDKNLGRTHCVLSIPLGLQGINYNYVPSNLERRDYTALEWAWITGVSLSYDEATTLLQSLHKPWTKRKYDVTLLSSLLGTVMTLQFAKMGHIGHHDIASISVLSEPEPHAKDPALAEMMIAEGDVREYMARENVELSSFTNLQRILDGCSELEAQTQCDDSSSDDDFEDDTNYWITQSAGPSNQEDPRKELLQRLSDKLSTDMPLMEFARMNDIMANLGGMIQPIDAHYAVLNPVLGSSLKASVLERLEIFKMFVQNLELVAGVLPLRMLGARISIYPTRDIANLMKAVWPDNWRDDGDMGVLQVPEPSMSSEDMF